MNQSLVDDLTDLLLVTNVRRWIILQSRRVMTRVQAGMPTSEATPTCVSTYFPRKSLDR